MYFYLYMYNLYINAVLIYSANTCGYKNEMWINSATYWSNRGSASNMTDSTLNIGDHMTYNRW